MKERAVSKDGYMNGRIESIARAFSGHRFEDAYPYLAEDVIWTQVGEWELTGKPAVVNACQRSAEYLATVRTDFRHFRAFVGEQWVVIDSLANYTDRQGAVSIVASCDIHEFEGDRLARVTSYNIALPGPDAEQRASLTKDG